MNLIQEFPECVSGAEALSFVCEGLGDARETTTAFSVILENWLATADRFSREPQLVKELQVQSLNDIEEK